MYGLDDLKTTFRVTGSRVECPVRECDTDVKRRREGDGDLRSEEFYCKQCEIYISPNTFEYKNEADNLLWVDSEDAALLTELKASKAEINRLSRERSEDAVSWNVFRYFDRTGKVCKMLRHLDANIDEKNPEMNAPTVTAMYGRPTRSHLDRYAAESHSHFHDADARSSQ